LGFRSFRLWKLIPHRSWALTLVYTAFCFIDYTDLIRIWVLGWFINLLLAQSVSIVVVRVLYGWVVLLNCLLHIFFMDDGHRLLTRSLWTDNSCLILWLLLRWLYNHLRNTFLLRLVPWLSIVNNFNIVPLFISWVAFNLQALVEDYFWIVVVDNADRALFLRWQRQWWNLCCFFILLINIRNVDIHLFKHWWIYQTKGRSSCLLHHAWRRHLRVSFCHRWHNQSFVRITSFAKCVCSFLEFNTRLLIKTNRWTTRRRAHRLSSPQCILFDLLFTIVFAWNIKEFIDIDGFVLLVNSLSVALNLPHFLNLLFQIKPLIARRCFSKLKRFLSYKRFPNKVLLIQIHPCICCHWTNRSLFLLPLGGHLI